MDESHRLSKDDNACDTGANNSTIRQCCQQQSQIMPFNRYDSFELTSHQAGRCQQLPLFVLEAYVAELSLAWVV